MFPLLNGGERCSSNLMLEYHKKTADFFKRVQPVIKNSCGALIEDSEIEAMALEMAGIFHEYMIMGEVYRKNEELYPQK